MGGMIPGGFTALEPVEKDSERYETLQSWQTEVEEWISNSHDRNKDRSSFHFKTFEPVFA
jgi:hypothetical protein